VPGWERGLTDFFQKSELGAVVEEGQTLVVSGAIGHDESPRPSQVVVHVCQIAVVPVSLLDGERIEPPDDLGDQLSVVPGSLLDAEVRDVPRGDEQPVWRLRRDPARELVLPEMIDLCAHIVRVLKLWLREWWHGGLRRRVQLPLRADRTANHGRSARLEGVPSQRPHMTCRLAPSRVHIRPVRQALYNVSLQLAWIPLPL